MEELRKIKRIVTGIPVTDGAGVKLVRVIGHHDVADFDPFLMLDAFDSKNPDDYVKGFPWHPHRGIETITYLIYGDVEHGDSLGNHGSILDGECQWMTAGSGIIHQEMPKSSPHMLGTQLWLNMPADKKMSPPKYNDIVFDKIPIIKEDDAIIRVFGGRYKEVLGAMEGEYVKPVYLDIELKEDGEFSLETDPEHTLFLYIVTGSGIFEPDQKEPISAKHAVLFSEGKWLSVRAGRDGIRFLFFAGKPLKEPIAWGGPIVMNTQEELQQAFLELENNTFIK